MNAKHPEKCLVALVAVCLGLAGGPMTPAQADPIVNPQPPSTLLPPGATSVELAVETTVPTVCALAVGQPLPFAQMLPFSASSNGLMHSTLVTGLSADPNTVNEVYVRCAAQPDFLLHLRYRSLSVANPPFPRTGNLWGWWDWRSKGLPYLARVDLWLGADAAPAAEIRELRRLNPHLRLLRSINAVENVNLSADYYLKDVNGRRIEVWPGSYRLNLTKKYVAEFQARYAYQQWLASGLMADGVFFDNVMTTQSWQRQDIYGTPVQIDADENGVADDPAAFDAAWKAGVFHEIRTFRQLMPQAIVSGHSMDIDEPGIAELFNGLSIGFSTANVIEGEQAFGTVWNQYHDWFARAVRPVTMMVESSPVDQIAYGYDYSPLQKIPPTTLAFARTYYPWVRFGLAFTLMNDGYFAHEYGDTWHGNDWWYDELDFNLGYPLGPAQRVVFPNGTGTNLIVNPGFEAPIVAPWLLNASSGATARLFRETTGAPAGNACARVDITATTGTDWHVEFAQYSRSLIRGVVYDFAFLARSSAPRFITVDAQKASPDWRNYGLSQRVWIGTNWQTFTVPFTATETVTDARLQFFLGETTGTVWLDGVTVTPHPPDVFRRDFTQGVVLLNGTGESREVTVGSGFRRFSGPQAPLFEWILDDQPTNFTTTGTWARAAYDSGEWKASGPFYHSWGGSLRERTSADGEARWSLALAAEDIYTISAWWPASPAASNWTHTATYEVVAGGLVVVSTNLDQAVGGDQWHLLATVRLSPTNNPYVRLTAPPGACVADALHLRSASRFNHGQPVTTVRLQPLDGILLQRDQPLVPAPGFRRAEFEGNQLQFIVTNLVSGLTNELLKTSHLNTGAWQVTKTFQTQGSETNLVEVLAPEEPTAFYRLRVQ